MPSYRVYCLDGAGKITSAEWLQADSDDEALRQARERASEIPCEVWDRNRLIGRVGGTGGL